MAKSMINLKLISKILGSLLFLEALLMAASLGIAILYGDDDTLTFIVSIIITLLFGFICKYYGAGAPNRMSRRDSYLVVTLIWVVFSLFGTLPFLLGGYLKSFTDAFFEAMSGFTTTGATIIDNVEELPNGILFWRSMTQWVGGIGIVFSTVALLPSAVKGSTKIFAAESSSPLRNKLHPRLSTSTRRIWYVYLSISMACMGCYKLFGMDWFQSANYAMTVAATGGFSIQNNSAALFSIPSIAYTTVFFCFLSGISFTLLYASVAKMRLGQILRNSEFRLYASFVIVATAFVMAALLISRGVSVDGNLLGGIEHAFRSALFQVVSFLTTTGLFNDNIAIWPHITWAVLALAMFVGACSGSTTGGIKCFRVVMLFKVLRNELTQRLHPNAVLPLKVNAINIPDRGRVSLLAFVTAYLALFLAISFVLMATGMGAGNALTVCLSCLSNVGPTLGTGLGSTVPWSALPAFAKWLCVFMMLVGRLEIFSVLVIFTPGFWTRN